MCITIYTLHKHCSCRHPKTVLPCPMMDAALDLVDLDGVPESDARVRQLEEQCGDKAATRYERGGDVCERCLRGAAVGAEAVGAVDDGVGRMDGVDGVDTVAVAAAAAAGGGRRNGGRLLMGTVMEREGGVGESGEYDYDGRIGGSAGMECGSSNNVQLAVGAMRFLRDDLLEKAPSSSVQLGSAYRPSSKPPAMRNVGGGANFTVDPIKLEDALRKVLGSREDSRGSHGEWNICDEDDEMFDVFHGVDAGTSR